jgi:glutathione synthase/RimK-type ligase-like ATP-grasp enzyme
MEEFHSLLKDICEEEGIKYKFLSKDWVTMLEKDNKTRFICGYKFDLNKHGIGLVIDDKYAMYEVLRSKGLKSIEYNILFRNSKFEDNYEYVLDYFYKHNNSIVLKPNEGTCGNNVIHITKEEDIDSNLHYLLKRNFSISMCPFYNIKNEYRFIMLGNECQICYGKERPIVIGDNKHTIKELLLDFNYNYFSNKELDSSYDRVLDMKEVFEYDWRFNLARGAISSFEIEEMDKNSLYNIFNDILNKLNIKFGSIDVIKTVDNHFYVMEINSGVMMDNFILQHEDGKKFAKEIYKEAIIKMFE